MTMFSAATAARAAASTALEFSMCAYTAAAAVKTMMMVMATVMLMAIVMVTLV